MNATSCSKEIPYRRGRQFRILDHQPCPGQDMVDVCGLHRKIHPGGEIKRIKNIFSIGWPVFRQRHLSDVHAPHTLTFGNEYHGEHIA